jgi:group I intron endonuclease
MGVSQIYEGVIYMIKNISSNKVYIGSSIYGLTKRKRCHITNLKNNKHHSIKLQNAWNKYGEDKFIFEIIEICNKEGILVKEQYWIDKYDSYISGYNATPFAGNCLGRKVKKETRLKISNSLKGRTIIRSNEHNKKLGVAKQKIVLLLDDIGNVMQEFESSLKAAEFLNVSQSNISANCRGINKSKKFNIRYK